MNRRNFTKNASFAVGGLILTPTELLKAQPTKEEVVFWPWLLRLAATAVVTKVAEKAVDYVADWLTDDEEKEVNQVVHNHNQLTYAPVHQYSKSDNDFLLAPQPTVAASPGPVHFFGRDRKHRQHAAKLAAPGFAAMTAATEQLAYQDSQNVAHLRDTILPRLITSTENSSGRNIPLSIYRYATRTATIAIHYELDDAAHSQYFTRVEILPYREVHHTRDCRYKRRTLTFDELLLMP